MTIAVKVENLGKRFLLGESIEHTLSSRVGDLLRGRVRRAAGREEFWALRDVNFEVKEGEALGIIGGNGAGKSTLLKVLSRITPPTEGRARVKGRLSSLLEVGTGFHPELTGRENVFLNGAILGMRKAEVQRKFDEIVAFSGVEKFIDTPVKRYSSGMYVRLAFAVAAHLEPDVLIIDEVLAVGDADFQKRCLGKMNDVAKQGRTVLFVSHNMAAVQKLCSRAIWMREGQVASSGEPGEVIGAYLEASGQHASGEADRPGYLYWRESTTENEDAGITSLQLLGEDGRPLQSAATFERLRFRVGFETRRAYRSFAVEIQVNTSDGVSLLLTSSSPDQSLPFSVEPGTHWIDCEFERFPLAAGEYMLVLSLAIPGIEYVWRNEALCRLRVEPRDVFGSGLPPDSRRYLVATSNRWAMVNDHAKGAGVVVG
ncbi:MAG: ABC transporter ATP-binding protein [Thermomonas sp.]|uniref:ABC transporter ATP-binding protein n=1 Tax=Thermomonas sp. TaxID=1971895 RepID=UPI00261F5289|nr:ABC transporter ATP-binding protein [Thermomonas sp.]MCC7096490.1 ABC transporter ATP-binding protein [Thermomonas sp.]